MATSSSSTAILFKLSSSPPSFTFKPLLHHRPLNSLLHSPPPYPLPHLLLSFSATRTSHFLRSSFPPQKFRALVWTTSVASAAEDVEVLSAPVNTDTTSEQIVSPPDDGVSNIISVLLFIAFVGLSILTIGVIYIAVTDFLQKRESKKFEEEEAAKKKKGAKKRKVKARAGPKGFGQKPVEEDDEDAAASDA